MKKTIIAIIDSGIDKNYMNSNIKNIIDLTQEGYQDYNGHGTMCYNFINKYCFKSDFVIVKILNKSGKCHSEALIKAFELLLEIEVNIIHLSVAVTATITKELNNKLLEICEQLNRQNKIIVASQANGRQEPVIPAAFPVVIGVEGTHMDNVREYCFNKNKIIQGLADSTPALVHSNHGTVDFFAGNSKAATIITIELIKCIEQDFNYSYHDLLKKLEVQGLHNEWDQKLIQIRKDCYLKVCEKYIESIFRTSYVWNKRLLNGLRLEFALFFLGKPKLVFCFFMRKNSAKVQKNLAFTREICRFVSYYCRRHSIDVNIDDINIFDFINIYALYNALY